MSKRKCPTSYSSRRRQIKAQVAADMKFIACDYDCDDKSSNSCEQECNSACTSISAGNFAEHSVLFTNDSDSDDEYDCECGACHVSSMSLTQSEVDFNDCHWVSSDSDDEPDMVGVDGIFEQLNVWAVKYSVHQDAIGELLDILKPHFPNLPFDARTLLKTPRTCNVRPLKNGGEYCPVSYTHLTLPTILRV